MSTPHPWLGNSPGDWLINSNTPHGVHQARRGDDQDAAGALTELLGRDDTAHTVAATATATDRGQLPEAVAGLLDTRAHALEKVRTVHELGAEVDWLAQIGGFSISAAYSTDTLAQAPGLDQTQRDVAATILGTVCTVHSLHLGTQAAPDKPALLAAVTACTRAADAVTIVIPGTEKARYDAAGYSDGTDGLRSAASMLAHLDTLPPDPQKESRLSGAVIIVDDADHLTPEQLRGLARHARARGSKLVLVTADTDPPRPGPARYLTDVAAAHLPWAQHLGAAVEPDTAIDRARQHHANRGVDAHIAEMLQRADKLDAHYQYLDRLSGRRRDRSQERSRQRSRDDDYGLDL